MPDYSSQDSESFAASANIRIKDSWLCSVQKVNEKLHKERLLIDFKCHQMVFIEFADRSLPGKFFIISANYTGCAVTKHFAACLKFKNLSLAQLPFVSRIFLFESQQSGNPVWQENNAYRMFRRLQTLFFRPDIAVLWDFLNSPSENTRA